MYSHKETSHFIFSPREKKQDVEIEETTDTTHLNLFEKEIHILIFKAEC